MTNALIRLLGYIFLCAAIVMVGGMLGMDPFRPFRQLVTTPQKEAKQKENEDDVACLRDQIWHPSFGKDPEHVQLQIGITVLNYRKDSKHNLCTIFQQGLAETPVGGQPLRRVTSYVRLWEMWKHGKTAYAEVVAHTLLSGDYKVPPELSVAACAKKFVRAREGTLISLDVRDDKDSGTALLRREIRKELGPPVLVLHGTEFYGTCR